MGIQPNICAKSREKPVEYAEAAIDLIVNAGIALNVKRTNTGTTSASLLSALILGQPIFEFVVIALLRNKDVPRKAKTSIPINCPQRDGCPIAKYGLPEQPGTALGAETPSDFFRRLVPGQIFSVSY